jgi:predicted AAA+ superfamily ATPase
MKEAAALQVANEYLFSLENSDFLRSDDKRIKRDSEKIKALIRSYARNTATPASIETIVRDTRDFGTKVSRTTIDSYLKDLKSLYVIQDQPAWNGTLRSRTSLRQVPKRHLVDPSLACAALGATKEKLLLDFNTFGFLFESLCVRDLRIYGNVHNASLSHYRDKTGLEVDVVIELPDGRWGLIEVKLSTAYEEQAAANLHAVTQKIDVAKKGTPSFLAIVTAGKHPYRRSDGIYVLPIGCLGP